MRATVTIYRYYYKKLVVEVPEEHIKGLTKEQIADKLFMADTPYEDGIFEASLESMDVDPDGVETDRYDIYNEKEEHVYGGHL
jgi:hypothetical protein